MLMSAIAFGLAAFYGVSLLRKLPGVRRWHGRGTKPWACDVCMSGWSFIAMGAAQASGVADFGWSGAGVIEPVAAAGVCLLLLSLAKVMDHSLGPPVTDGDFPWSDG